MHPRVSVVINTLDRARSLRLTLRSLRQLDYPEFEVVVVPGPCSDETEAVLAEVEGQVRVATCPTRNLSRSRNIGIALAAGEYVAFIDDDAYPDPAWLDRLRARFSDDEVTAVGGPVYDYTGVLLQPRRPVVERFGNWAPIAIDAAESLRFPRTTWTPYVMGTNSMYRRDRLVEVGGFDEEIEYHLDETDLCRRLVERGYAVEYADQAFVYHKGLPSQVHTEEQALESRFPILKSKCYFALKHGLKAASFADVCKDLAAFAEQQRVEVEHNIAHGGLDEKSREHFERELARAYDAGLDRYLAQRVTTRPRDWFEREQGGFLRFPTLRPGDRKLHVCLLTDEYLPRQLNGIARTVHTLATGLAAQGHVVRVLTEGSEPGEVDLLDGVWVHRVPIRPRPSPKGFAVPALWAYSAALLDELERIDQVRPIDIVQAPNWNALGVAPMRAGRFTTVLGLYTPLKTMVEMDARYRRWGRPRKKVRQLLEVEASTYRLPDAYIASTPSIIEEIEQRYRVELDRERVGAIAHGLPDGTARVSPATSGDAVEVLFVGRLEPRKGIDTLLECIPGLAGEFPRLTVTIVGNDQVKSPQGPTYRELFEASEAGRRLGARVRFTGVLDEEELLGRYAGCDVFVAPSRYESFGLILVEAMMFGKPVIACEVGGMKTIVEQEGNGLLVPPGNAAALREAIARLAASAELRGRYGRRSRQLYEQHYSAARMAQETNAFYDRLLGRDTASYKQDLPGRHGVATTLRGGGDDFPAG